MDSSINMKLNTRLIYLNNIILRIKLNVAKLIIILLFYRLLQKVFFELCDDNDDGFIEVDELRRFFTKNLVNKEDAKIARFHSK